MVIDFSKISLEQRPKFILRNLDDTAIGFLTNILNPSGKFCYNDVSEINFEYPAWMNGEILPEYDLLTGMRIVDVKGYGQFILRNPEETYDGVTKKKKCTGYSLEYEFTNKTISLEEGTYNFWNPFSPDSTVLGIILSEVKSWSVGSVSDDLIGKYRTFSTDGKNIYDWMKSDLQKTYGCIFEFDTYKRKINVRSINDIVNVKPVYLSTSNLIKEIEIKESTDDLVTVLDVNGADGVSIRSVNPMGTNRIYNLDAYMNSSYFSDKMITSWNKWKDTFKSYQEPYYQLVIAQNMQISRYTTEDGVLADLKGELTALESKKAVIIQAIAVDKALQSDLNKVNSQIRSKESEIKQQENLLQSVQNKIDSFKRELKTINERTSFSSFFTQDELIILDRYFRCGSLTDSNFVATSVDSYAVDTETIRGLSAIFNIVNATSVTKTPYGDDITFYIVRGGSINTNNSNVTIDSKIVHGTLQVNRDLSFVLSLYLENGKLNGKSFPGGTIAMTGNLSANATSSTNTLQFKTTSSTLYLTQEVTEYQKMSVEWELFEYGVECLQRLSSPTHSFSVSSINFLALEYFSQFAKELELGEKIYLHTDQGVLSPIVVAVSIDFDNPSDFQIDFGDAFSLNEATLEDLLKESISMGSTLDFNQYNYSNFVNSGAKTQVKDFMTNAIDTMKNRILSGDHEQITIDPAGLRCRKYNETSGDYEPEQIWMAHNALMFTKDGWNTATIGIGEFIDKNLGSMFGIIAPAIVGTILAGSQLVIESEKTDGGVAVFKVDAEGASLHNASFNLYGSTGGRIDLGAIYGIVGGANKDTLFYYDSKGQPSGVRTVNNRSIKKVTDISSGDSPNANFWLDMDGNAYLKGKLIATSGEIGGFTIASSYLYSGSGSTRVAINGGTSYYSAYAFWAGAENPANAPFWVKKNGDMRANNATISGKLVSPSLSGTLSASTVVGDSQAWLEGVGIRVGRNSYATKGYNFYVDPNGNVWMQGNLTLANGVITWNNLNSGVQSKFTELDNDITNMSWNIDQRLYNFNQRLDGVDQDINWLSQNMWTQQEIKNIASTQITQDLIASPRIYGAYIQGGTVDGANILFGSYGSMYDGYGSDGVNITDLVMINSYRGMRISASEGLGIDAGGGLWITARVHIKVNGSWVCINDAINK